MYRTIDTSLWTDPTVRKLPPLAKLLFTYLITNGHILIFVDSDDVHHREDATWVNTGKTDIIVSKAREGVGGIREVMWDGRTQGYKEIQPADPFTSEAAA